MLGYITKFLDAKNERRLKQAKIAVELMQTHLALFSKIAEIQIINSQNKCYGCKHKYEKHFANGGIVTKINQKEPEVVLKPEEISNIINKLKESGNLDNLKEKLKR